jgi:hypothetical protein
MRRPPRSKHDGGGSINAGERFHNRQVDGIVEPHTGFVCDEAVVIGS